MGIRELVYLTSLIQCTGKPELNLLSKNQTRCAWLNHALPGTQFSNFHVC